MKKIFIIGLLGLFSVSYLWADKQITRLVVQMNKLQTSGAYLEAMDTATYILTLEEDNLQAKEFVYRNWEKMQKKVDAQLRLLNDPTDLKEADERCEIYRLLDDIHGNLSVISLPLYGYQQKWVWQPEIGYYSGHYDNERMKTYRLLLSLARQAISDHDTDLAQEYVSRSYKYLVSEGEKRKCRKDVAAICNERLEKEKGATEMHKLIYAYDLATLSLKMDSTQTEIRNLQPQLQQKISEMYLQLAEEATQKGDSATAIEMRLSAEDWRLQQNEDDGN